MHMAAARLGCKRTKGGTGGGGLANSWPGCMSRHRKCYSHLSGGSFLAGKASWALSSLGTRPSKNRKGGSGKSAGVEVYTAPGMQAHFRLAFD